MSRICHPGYIRSTDSCVLLLTYNHNSVQLEVQSWSDRSVLVLMCLKVLTSTWTLRQCGSEAILARGPCTTYANGCSAVSPPIERLRSSTLLASFGRSSSDIRSRGGPHSLALYNISCRLQRPGWQLTFPLDLWYRAHRRTQAPTPTSTQHKKFHSSRYENPGHRCTPGSTYCRPPFLQMPNGYQRNQDRLTVPCGKNSRNTMHNVSVVTEALSSRATDYGIPHLAKQQPHFDGNNGKTGVRMTLGSATASGGHARLLMLFLRGQVAPSNCLTSP